MQKPGTLLLALGATLLLCASPLACSDSSHAADGSSVDLSDASPTVPTVVSTAPVDGAVGVPINRSVGATFSVPMDPGTLTAASFTVTDGVNPTAGTIIVAGDTAEFWPASHLATHTTYTATITNQARTDAGVALAANHRWSFTTGAALAPGLPVDLGAAGDFVILAKSGISTVPTSAITGSIGVSPAAATFLTGFALAADASNVFATSPQVIGKVYAANFSPPTPANLTTAVGDMLLAFTDAAGRAPDMTELGAGNIGGMTLPSGVYKWGTGLLIPTDLTLNGSATDVWIFQIAQDLTVSNAVQIHLAGGALARNVFWQVAGRVELGTTAHAEGTILAQTSITLGTGASINGRLLAQTAVNLRSNTVTESSP